MAQSAVPGPQKDLRVSAALGRRRKRADRIIRILCVGATMLGLALLSWILIALTLRGFEALSLRVFTNVTAPPGSQGGLLNPIVGSLIQSLLAAAIGTPIGMLVGTYLAEYAGASRLGHAVRFVSDILLSAPSILIGLFVYVILVEPFRGYSGWAGGVALGIIAIPVIVRTTEDMLNLVPAPLREAGSALGAPPSVVITSVTWRAAKSGMVTGILLALARIAGETAPLLFTALNNNFWFSPTLVGGVSNLPVTIYQFASAPYENWQQLAWAGSLIITVSILVLSIVARRIVAGSK